MGRIWSRQQEVVISDQSLPQSVHIFADLFVRLIGQVSYIILFNSKFKGKMILHVTIGWEGHNGIVIICPIDIKGLDLANLQSACAPAISARKRSIIPIALLHKLVSWQYPTQPSTGFASDSSVARQSPTTPTGNYPPTVLNKHRHD